MQFQGESLHGTESMLQQGCYCDFRSYRGYGLSQGTPTESGLQLDAQASLDYLHKNPAVKDNVSLTAFCLAVHMSQHTAHAALLAPGIAALRW